MKFGIDMGHNCPPHDVGASGVRQEDVVIKEVGTRLIAKLAAAGHSVINCTPTSAVSLNDSLRKRANKANSNVDNCVIEPANSPKPKFFDLVVDMVSYRKDADQQFSF